MNCHEAQLFVSALYDGEPIPEEAAGHIGSCASCRNLLRQYAQMGAELRLLASAEPITVPAPPGRLSERRRRWAGGLTARVLVPRFAIALALIAITGLSVGLALVRGQGSRLWFQFELSSRVRGHEGGTGGLLQAGEPATGGFLPGESGKKIAANVRALEVQKDVVRLEVRTRTLVSEVRDRQGANQYLADASPQYIDYVPGQKLEIPVEGAGNIVLTGNVYRIRPSFPAAWYPVPPQAGEIVLTNPAMVRDHEFLGNIAGSASAKEHNSAIGACVPPLGEFVFALKLFPGATRGVVEFGQAHFKMDGHQYILFSATPITGGQQPREIWVYRAPACPISKPVPMILGSGDASDLLKPLQMHSGKGKP